MPVSFTAVSGDWRVLIGTRTTRDVAGTVRIVPRIEGDADGVIADRVKYTVHPLTLPVESGSLTDPDLRVATDVDGHTVGWSATFDLHTGRRPLRLPPATFTATDAIDGVLWLSALTP